MCSSFVKKNFMKKSILISALILPASFIIFSSNSNGPAQSGNGIRNGGPSSNGTCGSCHGGGSGTTTINMALVEKATGTPANGMYMPSTTYTVTISGNNPNLPLFGFQMSAATASNQQGGLFANPGANKHISMLSGLQIVEHSSSLSKTNGNYETSFDWTAPAAGKGTITFYGIINGVNNDDDITGDKPSTPSTLSLTEHGATTSITDYDLSSGIRLYPNPTSVSLNISSEKLQSGMYAVSILDMNGKLVWQGKRNIDPAKAATIPVDFLSSGIYALRLEGNNKKVVLTFAKK
jgi:hypothetical protein